MAESVIIQDVVEFDYGNAGPVFVVTCPECQDTRWVTFGDSYEPDCPCGYYWHISITATGRKNRQSTTENKE